MKRYGGLLFCIALTVASVCATFFFSGQNAEASGNLSGGIVRWLLARIAPGYTEQVYHAWSFFLRKAAHFTLYLLLGIGLAGSLQWQKRLPPWATAIALGTLFAATDELHQLFSPGRSAQLTDVLLDACGVATGTLVVYLIYRTEKKKQEKAPPPDGTE